MRESLTGYSSSVPDAPQAPVSSFEQKRQVEIKIIPGLRDHGVIADFGRSRPLSYSENILFPFFDRQIKGELAKGDCGLIEAVGEDTLRRLHVEREIPGSEKGLAVNPRIEGLTVNRLTVYRSQQTAKNH